MAVAFVQGKATEAGNASSVTVTLTSTATVGNLLVVGVYAFGETTSSITVQALVGSTPTSDTWTKVLTAWQADSGGSDFFNLFYCIPATSGITAIKASGPSGTGFWGLAVGEFSGVGTPTVSTQGGSAAADNSNPYNGPTMSPNPTAGDLVVAFYGDEGGSTTITAGTGWSLAGASSIGDDNNALIYQLSSAGGSTHGSWNRANFGDAAGSVYAAFTPGSAGPTDPFPAGYQWRQQIDYNAVYRM